jgi:integrase
LLVEFDFLTFEEPDRLIAGAEDEWRAMVIVALRTGLRHGELIGLRWIDVDLDAGRLVIRAGRQDRVHGTRVSQEDRAKPLLQGACGGPEGKAHRSASRGRRGRAHGT